MNRQVDERQQAMQAAVKALAATARSRWEIERLLLKAYAAEVVQEVLERLAAERLLDDGAFARQYVRIHPHQGAERLLADLLRRGVDPQVARESLHAERRHEDRTAAARTAALQRLGRMVGVSRQVAVRRLWGYLTRLGYEPDSIEQALSPLLENLPEAPERNFGEEE